MSYPPVIVQALLLLVVIPAAIFDFRERRVPNWLALSGLLLGIGLNAFLDVGIANLRKSLEGLGVAFVIYFLLYLLRAMGAGDAKLMAAVGSIVGFPNWLGIFVLTALFGGIAAITLVVAKKRIRRTIDNIGLILVSMRRGQAPYDASAQLDVRSDQGLRLPHAVVIAFGAIGFLVAAGIWAPH